MKIKQEKQPAAPAATGGNPSNTELDVSLFRSVRILSTLLGNRLTNGRTFGNQSWTSFLAWLEFHRITCRLQLATATAADDAVVASAVGLPLYNDDGNYYYGGGVSEKKGLRTRGKKNKTK